MWMLYLLEHSEHRIAVLDEIVKEEYYGRVNRWVYTVYVHVTYQGESFREKMKFTVTHRIIGFARGYEIPVIVSCSKRGKLWVFQNKKEDKWDFVFVVVFSGAYALLIALLIYAVLYDVFYY